MRKKVRGGEIRRECMRQGKRKKEREKLRGTEKRIEKWRKGEVEKWTDR